MVEQLVDGTVVWSVEKSVEMLADEMVDSMAEMWVEKSAGYLVVQRAEL